MGAVWWTYGKGLLGPAASWQPVAENTVVQDSASLYDTDIDHDGAIDESGLTPAQVSQKVDDQLVDRGWTKLLPSVPAYQQAGAAATTMLEETGAFQAGEFQVVEVFEKGGERSPQPFGGEPTSSRSGTSRTSRSSRWHRWSPSAPNPDERRPSPSSTPTRPHQYVLMVRDLGALRQPAGFITVGSLIVFLVLCYLLHSRDRVVAENKAAKAIPAKTST